MTEMHPSNVPHCPAKVLNFAAGPAKIPAEVLRNAVHDMISYKKTGVGIMELSHRGPEYKALTQDVDRNIRTLMNIPKNYKVLLLHGGGTGQFAAIPLNLIERNPSKVAYYYITGCWSEKAAKEAEKYGQVKRLFPNSENKSADMSITSDVSYVYFCANETVHGIEFNGPTNIPDDIPIVCDASSCILGRPMDINKFGIVIAGAQKNLGCAGTTVAIVRDDCLNHAMNICPTIWNYKEQSLNESCLNTPSTYAVYILGEVLKWCLKEGGLSEMIRRNQVKSSLIYNVIDKSHGFYTSPVNTSSRSHLNVVFRIGSPGDEKLEKRFLEEAKNKNMIQLKGHRSVGGLRASLYNAVSIEETKQLSNFLVEFQAKYYRVINPEVKA